MKWSITAFERALESPEKSFRTLGGRIALPSSCREVELRRTALFAEAEMLLDGQRWLVCMPLDDRATVAAERVASLLEGVRSDFLVESRLLRSELELSDGCGRSGVCDILIQRLPEGEPFGAESVSCGSDRLRKMVGELQSEFSRLGFSHNNLKPSNIVVGDDGRLHPLRYVYATLDGECRDDFAPLYAVADALAGWEAECGDDAKMSVAERALHDICAGYDTPAAEDDAVFPPHEGLVRFCRAGRYGFMDEGGAVVIEPRYVWADDFREGRATVEGSGGMGLVDKSGHEVVPARFDDLCYDVRTGRSRVRLRGKCAEFSYSGEQLTDFL